MFLRQDVISVVALCVLKLTCRAIVQAYPREPLLMRLFYDAILASCMLHGGRHCSMYVTKLEEMRVGRVVSSLKVAASNLSN